MAWNLEQEVLGHPPAITRLGDLRVDELARRVTGVVSGKKATWTRWNITADQLTADGLDTALTDLAIEESRDGANRALAGLRRDIGESVLVEHGSTGTPPRTCSTPSSGSLTTPAPPPATASPTRQPPATSTPSSGGTA